MQSESMETRLESDVVVKPVRATRRVAWSLAVIVLLIGYTAGFFTRPRLMPAAQPLEPMEIDPAGEWRMENGEWRMEIGFHFPSSPFHLP